MSFSSKYSNGWNDLKSPPYSETNYSMERFDKEHDRYRAFLVGSRQISSREHQVAHNLSKYDKIIENTADGGINQNNVGKTAFYRGGEGTD